MKTILVPIDGSEYSERALLKAKELADCMGSKVILLNVMSVASTITYYPNPRYAQIAQNIDWPSLLEGAKKKSEELLENSKALLGDTDSETVTLDDPTGRFAHAIVDYANERDVDLIVMGSNGVGSLRSRLYLGSITTKVLHMTERPVMVIQ